MPAWVGLGLAALSREKTAPGRAGAFGWLPIQKKGAKGEARPLFFRGARGCRRSRLESEAVAPKGAPLPFPGKLSWALSPALRGSPPSLLLEKPRQLPKAIAHFPRRVPGRRFWPLSRDSAACGTPKAGGPQGWPAASHPAGLRRRWLTREAFHLQNWGASSGPTPPDVPPVS